MDDAFSYRWLFFWLLLPPILAVENWRTGDWGPCISPSCGDGQRKRDVWCSDSEGFKTSERNCDSRGKPISKEDCFKVCDDLEPYLWWDIGEWSPCRALQKPNNTTQCQDSIGIARRKVICKYVSSVVKRKRDSSNNLNKIPKTRRVPDDACSYFAGKPKTETTCSVDCPQDCAVIRVSGDYNYKPTSLTTVIIPPRNGGKECPKDYISYSSCQKNGSACVGRLRSHRHTNISFPVLKIGAWGPCERDDSVVRSESKVKTSAYIQVSSFGLQRRNFTCIHSTGETVSIKNCLQNPEDPASLRRCLISVDCSWGAWSEWNQVREGCVDSKGKIHPEIRERRREVLRFSQGTGKPCSSSFERRIITNGQPNCGKYKWLPLAWSSCVIHTDMEGVLDVQNSCGFGQKKRIVICVHAKDLRPVAEKLCYEERPLEIDPCFVQCDHNCTVSSWTSWSGCIPINFNNKFLKPEQSSTKRSRRILTPATGKGLCLLPLQQADDCNSEFDPVYDWTYGPWGQCVVDDGNSVGFGKRTRNRQCVLYNNKEIPAAYCQIYSFVDENDECYVPRVNDCVLSEWSEWSICTKPCNDGRKTRKRTILAYSGRESNYTCDKEELEDTEDCNEWLCEGYSWKPGSWQTCQIQNGEICGKGVQKRIVWCVKNGIPVAKKNSCSMLPDLPKERLCEVPCPVDCKLTPFSEYSTCPELCDLGARKERERFIIEEPKHGGKKCPLILKESRPCYEDNDVACLQKDNYAWFRAEWSLCTPLDASQGCGQGLQTREIACQNTGKGSFVEPWLCLKKIWKGDVSNFTFGLPARIRSCFVNCSTGCARTTWQPDSSCQGSCEDVVYSQHFIGFVGNKSRDDAQCRKNEDLREVRNCPKPEVLNVEDSFWSDCVLLDKEMDCGEGLEYRRSNMINKSTCQQTGVESRKCLIQCPVDCIMSQWSQWSACTTIHNPGYRSRMRQVIQKPSSEGRPCPDTVQNQLEEEFEVSRSCDRYKWVAEPFWSQCHLSTKIGKQNCGTGYQTRKIKCYLSVDNKPTETVSNELCNAFETPTKRQPCTLPCPGDCVVSDWSDWTSCQQPCEESLNRTRTRTVLRQPDFENNVVVPCPLLNETEECVLGKSCFNYEWVMGPWSSCILPLDVHCGFGAKERASFCRRQDGLEVDASLCQHLPEFEESRLRENCSVECSVDCLLSPWTQWDESECLPCSGNGTIYRKRKILQLPSKLGRPCGINLTQSKPCQYKSCYTWKLSSWSNCKLGANDSNVCGQGIKNRSVKCLRSDGIQVENSFCLIVNLTVEIEAQLRYDEKWLAYINDAQEEEECHVPCPGDCVLTPWSKWSECHRECFRGETTGFRTRSRTVLIEPSRGGENCSGELYETRPCWTGDCLSYEWISIGHDIKCRRSDGLVVIGAFSANSHPCVGACLALGAQSDLVSGSCRCPTGSRFSSSDDEDVELASRFSSINESDPGQPFTFTVKVGRCGPMMGLEVSKNVSDGPRIFFLPDDNEASFWMYAMISVGTAFVIFVIATIYLMCHSSFREKVLQVQRRRNLRRRSTDRPDPYSETMVSFIANPKVT